jgi:hypothetical protein
MRGKITLKEITGQTTRKAEGGLGGMGRGMGPGELEQATVQVFQQVAFIVFSSQKDAIPDSQEREVVKFLIEKGFKGDWKAHPNVTIRLFFVVRCLLMRYGNAELAGLLPYLMNELQEVFCK